LSGGLRGVSFPHSFAHSVDVDKTDPNIIYAGSINGGYRSLDGAATWLGMSLPDGVASTLATHVSFPGVVYAFNHDFYKSVDNGMTWTDLNGFTLGGWNEGDFVIDPGPAATIYWAAANYWAGTAYDGIYKSTDGGVTWSLMNTGLPSPPEIHTLAINPQDPNVLFAGTAYRNPVVPQPQQGIYRTTDGGQHWTQLHGGLPSPIYVNQIAVHPLQPNIVYAASEMTNSGIYKSTDGGDTWTRVLSDNSNIVMMDPGSPNIVYAGTWNTNGFYMSRDGGATWTKFNAGLPIEAGIESIALDPSNPRHVIIGTTAGEFHTTFSSMETTVGPAGGTGGSDFSMSCAGGSVVTALRGGAGDDIDRTELWCSPLVANGYGPASLMNAVGGFGGSPYDFTCPAGMALTGVHGRAGTVLWGGDAVDTIGATCRNVTSGATYQSPAAGNAAPAANPFTLDCPPGRVVVGLFGGQGSLLDRIGLVCR
jgi:photosystem II stability/assembly factor-like uncharacterized protein